MADGMPSGYGIDFWPWFHYVALNDVQSDSQFTIFFIMLYLCFPLDWWDGGNK